jgi:Niemann-Pick C1 protein
MKLILLYLCSFTCSGVLQVAGLYINVVSYIAMVMSIGLLVDFVCHMLLRYYETPGNTRDEKTKETLRTMGSSILLGSLSTFLGVLPLAFSTSEIFTTIFKAFIGLVTLGAAQGLILLPVVLSLVGPLECTRTPKSTTTTRENSKEESHASESIAI